MSTEAPERAGRLEVVDEDDPFRTPARSARYLALLTRLRTPQPPGTRSVARAMVMTIATLVSLLALWTLAYAIVFSGLQESRTQTVLYAQLREGLSGATTPIGGQIQPGTALMLVDVPNAGLHNAVVVEGTTSGDLAAGPGHLASTPLPGQPGVAVLFGRSVTFGSPFRDIAALQVGDPITVTTGQGTFHYTVDRVRLPGDPLPAPPAANTSRLTLVTSSGQGWRAGWAPQQTVYVDATMSAADTVQPVPSGRPSGVADAARPMHGDTSGLLPLVFWLQGFILVAVVVVWTRARWSTWQTWLIAMPLVLACLWGTTAAATQLLPNLI